MDPAKEYDNLMLSRQKPMNAVIDRGDSAIQQFYSGAVVFVTGGSGFLGKQLIEKLFRACDIKKVYILLRFKKGKTIQERLDFMLKDPAFDMVRKKKPDFADRIVPVEGDVADIRLGLSEKDWTTITTKVDMVIHMAATIRFDEPLHTATLTNVRGTRETIALAKECTKLKNFVYVSTAFTHATYYRVGKEVLEQFYPVPMPPEVLIGLAESVAEDRLTGITPNLIKGWPNTYTFTKALAEELVRTTAGELPVSIVRPPIVICSYLEPTPGWLDMSCVFGPTGIFLGVSLGVLHTFFVDIRTKLALVPVDYVNNAIIAAGWDSAEKRIHGDKEIPIYTVSNTESTLEWAFSRNVIATECIKFMTPKAVWYGWSIETNNRFFYCLLMWVFHYIPAYILDGAFAIVPMKPKGVPSFLKIYSKIDKLSFIYRYFLTNEWKFCDHNVKAMTNKMSDNDKMIFNCDINTVNKLDFIKVWAIGLRKYIIKEELKDSLAARKKQKLFGIANCIVLILYFYVLYRIFCEFWKITNYIF